MELVKFMNDKPITELKVVCYVYGKNHYHVMRDIREIIKDLPSLECEFIKTTYKNRGKEYPTYYLTEKGFYILSSSFKGKKAREFQSKFFDAFKALQAENKMLRTACTKLLTSDNPLLDSEILSTEEIIKQVKALQAENKMLLTNNYITDNSYCISDIAQKFKDLSPMQAQHELYMHDWLEYRKNGLFPTEFYDKNNDIVSVLDIERKRYYPRYTISGVIKVENFLKELGYHVKTK